MPQPHRSSGGRWPNRHALGLVWNLLWFLDGLLGCRDLARDGVLDPVQRAFLEHGALQCGYCTPGMILATKALLAESPSPTDGEIAHFLRGNICRCTGYVKIREAVRSLGSASAGSDLRARAG